MTNIVQYLQEASRTKGAEISDEIKENENYLQVRDIILLNCIHYYCNHTLG